MTARTFTFEVAKHEEYGTLGFRPTWYKAGDPLGGMAAAHDILEHWRNDDGSAEGELMALGASGWIRGDGGYTSTYGRYYDRVRDPAGDITDVWDRFIYRDRRTELRPCGLVRDSSAIGNARDCVAEAMKTIRERMEEGTAERPSKEAQERMARWIARGYVQAQRRYRHVIGGACAMASLFMEIEREADKALKHADEGMLLTVAVNVKRCRADVACDYPEEYYR